MGKTKLNAGGKGGVRSHVALPETDARTLPGKAQPHGDTQIYEDGLN